MGGGGFSRRIINVTLKFGDSEITIDGRNFFSFFFFFFSFFLGFSGMKKTKTLPGTGTAISPGTGRGLCGSVRRGHSSTAELWELFDLIQFLMLIIEPYMN